MNDDLPVAMSSDKLFSLHRLTGASNKGDHKQ
jgi:hypothetical protein